MILASGATAVRRCRLVAAPLLLLLLGEAVIWYRTSVETADKRSGEYTLAASQLSLWMDSSYDARELSAFYQDWFAWRPDVEPS